MNILYISYDGVTDLVSRSQVIPYLEKLARKGYGITFLSFEKSLKDCAVEAAFYQGRFDECHMDWIAKRYHKNPVIPATVFDILQGIAAGAQILKKKKIDAIHVRGYISACIGFTLKYIFKISIIFDMRGFWVDEKIDAGSWKKGGIVYRIVKRLETVFITKSDEIVVLTEAAKRFVLDNYRIKSGITVVPCCVNTDLFKPVSTIPAANRRVILYAGNLGTFYNLDGILDFFNFLKRADKVFFLRIASGCKRDMVDQKAVSNKVDARDYSVEKLDYDRMPEAFSRAEFSIIFYNRKLSGKGCCPIKFAESLSSGTPVVINAGIGDCDRIVTENRVGVIIKDLSRNEYERTFTVLKEFAREREAVIRRCRETALRYFSLDDGVEKYKGIYERVKR